MKIRYFLLGILFLPGAGAYAQRNCTPEELAASRAALHRADRFTEDSLHKLCPDISSYPAWVKGSDLVHFSTVGDGGMKTFYLADAATGRVTRLFDAAEYKEKVLRFTGKEPNVQNLRFNVTGLKDKHRINCRIEGKDAVYNLKTKEFLPADSTKAEKRPAFVPNPEPWKSYSADSTLSIYGKRHNIYLSRTGSHALDSVIQLTNDAEAYYSFTTYRTGETDDKLRSWRGRWFRDTHIAYAIRGDYRKVSSLTIVNSIAEPKPTATEYKFEVPGDQFVTQYDIVLVYADSARVVQADIEKFKDQEVKLAFESKDHPHDAIYFTRKNRVCDTLELCRIDPYTAKVTTIVAEVSQPIVNHALHNFAILNGGKDIIWWSERSGKGGYYLYDRDGRLKNVIVEKDFVAAQIFKIDTVGRSMIFEGYGLNKAENPYYRKYYRVNFDGSGFTELTPAEGYHNITLSDGQHYVMDRYSTVEQMPRTEVRDMKGRLKVSIPMPDDRCLVEAGWSRPKIETCKAADGVTDLYGVVFTPSDLDPSKKYPVICAVYPGPHTDMVPQEFGLDHDYNGSLAQMGFIVVQFGYRGTSPYRGRDFFTYGYGNMRDYALEDCKSVVEQLAAKYAYIDPNRVGIFGHSGGGFMSAAAILTYPDFFKVAVAISGNYDNNVYGKYWAEPYHGVKQVIEKDSTSAERIRFESRIPTTLELADRLKGRLMLITGEIDNNVHPANTIRMANALIKSNKRFDMLILPGRDHGMIGDYYYNTIRYYFEEYLKYPKPFDVDIVKHSGE